MQDRIKYHALLHTPYTQETIRLTYYAPSPTLPTHVSTVNDKSLLVYCDSWSLSNRTIVYDCWAAAKSPIVVAVRTPPGGTRWPWTSSVGVKSHVAATDAIVTSARHCILNACCPSMLTTSTRHWDSGHRSASSACPGDRTLSNVCARKKPRSARGLSLLAGCCFLTFFLCLFVNKCASYIAHPLKYISHTSQNTANVGSRNNSAEPDAIEKISVSFREKHGLGPRWLRIDSQDDKKVLCSPALMI